MKLKKLGKLSTYFLYDDNIEGLRDVLKDSIGIQCQIARNDGEIFQGEIASVDFPDRTQRIVDISVSWLCERRIVTKTVEGALMQKEDRWIPVNESQHHFLIRFEKYYLNKYNRLKIKCDESNWYILNREDPENLVIHEGDYERIGKIKGVGAKAPHIEPFKQH
jgi:hypothetical protein